MKKQVLPELLVTIVAASALWLVGCEGEKERIGERPGDAAPRSAVTLLHYFSGALSGGIAELAQEFNTKNAQHELRPVPIDHEAFKTSIHDTLKSGNPPDLYSYWAGARTAALVEHLEPLDDIWQQGGMDSRFPPSLAKTASEYGGRKYLIPITQHYVAFFYNKKVFAAHRVTPPTTWEDLLAACTTLKAAGIAPIALGARDKWPAQFWFDFLLLRTAPFEFRQSLMTGAARFDDPKVLAAFARWKTLIDKGCFNSTPHPNDLAWDTGANEMVVRGEAAMTLMGTWTISHFEDRGPRWKAGEDYDFFPFPIIDPSIPLVSLGPVDGLIMPKRAANPAGAKAALLHMAHVDAQKAFSRRSGALSPSLQVEDAFYSDIQRRVREELSRGEHIAFNFDLATPPHVANLGLYAFSEFLAFPESYRQIAQGLAESAAAYFSAPPPAR